MISIVCWVRLVFVFFHYFNISPVVSWSEGSLLVSLDILRYLCQSFGWKISSFNRFVRLCLALSSTSLLSTFLLAFLVMTNCNTDVASVNISTSYSILPLTTHSHYFARLLSSRDILSHLWGTLRTIDRWRSIKTIRSADKSFRV